jgi:hypothetical protein
LPLAANKLRRQEMKKIMVGMVLSIVMVFGTSFAIAAEKAPQKIVDLAYSTLVNIGSDPVIVAAVKAENAKRKSLSEIKSLDSKWKATAGIADYMNAMMESVCGKHLREIQNSEVFYAELFVMDNLGANVCMSDKTSDYWQGDEAKFKESYKGGAGAVHVSNVKFDDSTQAYLVQVSVPVKDDGKVIGAITIGVDVDKAE